MGAIDFPRVRLEVYDDPTCGPVIITSIRRIDNHQVTLTGVHAAGNYTRTVALEDYLLNARRRICRITEEV